MSQCNHRLRPFFLNCCTFTVLPALSAHHQTHACSNSTDSSTAKPMAFALSHTSVRTSGTISFNCYSVPSKANPRHFPSPNILFKPHCPSPLCLYIVCVRACVCVCVCVCVRARVLHIGLVIFEPLLMCALFVRCLLNCG